MKIEDKGSDWNRCHKGGQRGNINRMWRDTHKSARNKWKRLVIHKNYEALIKRI